MSKTHIVSSFDAAAAVYDRHAGIQRRVATRLADLLLETRATSPKRILEIGCGTGYLTERLLNDYPQAEVIASDFAPAMVETTRRRLAGFPAATRLQTLVCDGERLPFAGVDWIVSSMTFQWFDRLDQALPRLFDASQVLAFATLLDGTFQEWRAAHVARGLVDGIRAFPPERDVMALCGALTSKRRCRAEIATDHFDRPTDFLRSLRGVGAGTPRPGHRPAPLHRLLRDFPDGITVSYHMAYGILEHA